MRRSKTWIVTELPLFPAIYLWRMVVLQLLTDASREYYGNCYQVKTRISKIWRDTFEYCQLDNEDFKTVCTFAELSHECIYDKIQEIKRKNPCFHNGIIV